METILVILGFISLILGIIGTLLPVVPTIPFLFVAYICFSKGSPRFRRWYIHSMFYKKMIKARKFYKSVPLIYKIMYVIGVSAFVIAVITVWLIFYPIIMEYIRNLLGM